jgi:DNA transformation protein
MSRQLAEHVAELLQAMGPVEARAMFGGHGIFVDGVMFGLIADEALYLKADAENRAEFERLGLEPFVYRRKGRPVTMSYNAAPPEALEDAESLTHWAESAYAAARRARG